MNRRKSERYRLRVYFDAIRDAMEKTDEMWIEEWIRSGSPWVSRDTWINILETWALREARSIATRTKEKA